MDKLVTTRKERYWNPEAFARDQWVQQQAQRLPAGSWVLDAGAGASKYRPYFAHCRYETQDFCAYQGPLVKYREAITYVCDITAVPLPNGALDAVLCTEVFEHVPDPMRVLSEFKRLIKPGGKLLLTAPLISHLHMEPYHYYGGFTAYWYQHWLPLHQFAIESVTAVGAPGRLASIFLRAFHNNLARADQRASGLRRLGLRILRAGLKLPLNHFLPYALTRCDAWLDQKEICAGYLVAATRTPDS